MNIREQLSTNFWARLAVIFVPLALLALYILWASLTSMGQTKLLLNLAAYCGPPLLLGGVIGWLTYSRKQWLIWTSIFFVVVFAALFNAMSKGVDVFS